MKIIGDWRLSQTNQFLKFKLCWCETKTNTPNQYLEFRIYIYIYIYIYISKDVINPGYIQCLFNKDIWLYIPRFKVQNTYFPSFKVMEAFAPNKLQLISRSNRASSYYITPTSFLKVTKKQKYNFDSSCEPKKWHSFFCSSYITIQPATRYSQN